MRELEPKLAPPQVASIPEARPPDPARGSASEDSRASASVALLSEPQELPALCQEPVVWVQASALGPVSLAQAQRGQGQLGLLKESRLVLVSTEFPIEATLKACPD